MRNNRIKNLKTELLSDNWYILNKVSYQYKTKDDEWKTHSREAYDRGNGATILLYNLDRKTVILTRQFRLPTYLNGNDSGLLIEACAGLLDDKSPEDCIKKETEEETGYVVEKPQKIFESYMSPGSVTEILYFYIAEYNHQMKKGIGGGLANEQEEIEVLEISFKKAYDMIHTGDIKDAKTIMLLQYCKINIFRTE